MIPGEEPLAPAIMEEATVEGDHEWLVSYTDILTLLLTLFALLLALSHFNAGRSPAAAPSPAAHSTVSGGTGPPPAAAQARTVPPTIPPELRALVAVHSGPQDVTLTIKDDVLFARGSDELQPGGRQVLSQLIPLLSSAPYSISVEGHTDSTPVHTPRFPSNWELSTARATRVTRFLIAAGMGAARLRAIGYADTRPEDANTTAEGRARNRRVSLVLHLDAPARHPPPTPQGGPSPGAGSSS